MNRFCKLIFTCLLLITAVLSSCRDNVNNMPLEPELTPVLQSTDIHINKDDLEPIKDIIQRFYSAIEQEDSEGLKTISSQDGIKIIRIATSENDTREQNIQISQSDIPHNLIFHFEEGGYPVQLKDEFRTNYDEISVLKFRYIDEECHWGELPGIESEQILGEIVHNEINAGDQTVIYLFKDGSFSLIQFSGSGLQFISWAIFEKKANEYYLKGIALFR